MGGSLPTAGLPKMGETSDASAVLRHDTSARFWLAIIVIAQFVVLVGFIVYRGTELPDSQLILGAEVAMTTTVIQFFFGSSSGSVTKSASKVGGQSTETTSSP